MSDHNTNEWGVQTRHEATIGGYRYELDLYPSGEVVDEHIPFLLKLSKGPVGVALDLIRSIVKRGLREADVPGYELREGFGALADELEGVGSARIRSLLKYTRVHRSGGGMAKCSEDFDEIFQGRYEHLVEVLVWVLRCNFAPLSAGATSGAWVHIRRLWSELQDELKSSPDEPTSSPRAGSS